MIERFEILTNERVGTKVHISGVLDKVRSCEFKQLVVYSVKEKEPAVLLHLETNTPATTRAPGFQRWGPWTVDLPSTHTALIQLGVYHICEDRAIVYSHLALFSVTGEDTLGVKK